MKFLLACIVLYLVVRVQVSQAVKCDGYIKVIDSFPDGYRSRLSLPVLKNTNSWKLEIELDKPLTAKILSNPDHKITKRILYLYSMESFIYFELNKASRNKDISKI